MKWWNSKVKLKKIRNPLKYFEQQHRKWKWTLHAYVYNNISPEVLQKMASFYVKTLQSSQKKPITPFDSYV